MLKWLGRIDLSQLSQRVSEQIKAQEKIKENKSRQRENPSTLSSSQCDLRTAPRAKSAFLAQKNWVAALHFLHQWAAVWPNPSNWKTKRQLVKYWRPSLGSFPVSSSRDQDENARYSGAHKPQKNAVATSCLAPCTNSAGRKSRKCRVAHDRAPIAHP